MDLSDALGGNVSGLVHDPAHAALWAVRNDPAALLRLVEVGAAWAGDPGAGGVLGRALRYPSNTGNPDAEGVTAVLEGGATILYVAAERDNDAPSVSRNSILRYDPSQSGAALRASHEWSLGPYLPTTSSNAGIEAIAWVPDSMLVANGLLDPNTGQTYRPANYPAHGNGLFFVGVEATATVVAFALDHTTGIATRVASIDSGLSAVMGMEYDAATGQLWVVCDNGCDNRLAVLALPTNGVRGEFHRVRRYAPPTSLPNVNNEGFALAPPSACLNGRRFAYWVDDSNTGGHVLRRASRDCVVPESR